MKRLLSSLRSGECRKMRLLHTLQRSQEPLHLTQLNLVHLEQLQLRVGRTLFTPSTNIMTASKIHLLLPVVVAVAVVEHQLQLRFRLRLFCQVVTFNLLMVPSFVAQTVLMLLGEHQVTELRASLHHQRQASTLSTALIAMVSVEQLSTLPLWVL